MLEFIISENRGAWETLVQVLINKENYLKIVLNISVRLHPVETIQQQQNNKLHVNSIWKEGMWCAGYLTSSIVLRLAGVSASSLGLFSTVSSTLLSASSSVDTILTWHFSQLACWTSEMPLASGKMGSACTAEQHRAGMVGNQPRRVEIPL